MTVLSTAAGRSSAADVRALEAASRDSRQPAAPILRAHSSAMPARAVTPSGFSATASPVDSTVRAEPRDSSRGLSRSSKLWLSVESPRPKRLSDVCQAEQTLSPQPSALSRTAPRSPPPTTSPTQLAQSISNWAGRLARNDGGSSGKATAQHAARARVEERRQIPQGGHQSPPRALQLPSHHSPPHSESASWSAPFVIHLERTPTATMAASPTGPFVAESHGVGIRFAVTDSGLVMVTGILEGAAAARDGRMQGGMCRTCRMSVCRVYLPVAGGVEPRLYLLALLAPCQLSR